MKIKSFNQIFDKKHPILVAEISANHVGKISNAKKLIDIAKKYGADAVKLQTYKPSTMTINSKKNILKLKKACGKMTHFGTSTKKHTHHMSGIKSFLIMPKKKKLFVLVLHLMSLLLIF